MIKVLFFAQLRENLGRESVEVELQSSTVEQLKDLLISHNPEWKTALQQKRLLVAVNQNMAQDKTQIQSGDEVAFFPPVTGG
ncbi:molybdopterin synthase sulfur carrier subunit [Catenovulum sp. SX2]|uniref:molybdopterin synthase sulfur carrier subunit n=1 Tax=Catenovulum sp. SX2 TaxID=3398614 RepID=UPI003F843FB1